MSHVIQQRRVARIAGVSVQLTLEEHALPQPRLGCLQTLEAARLHHPLHVNHHLAYVINQQRPNDVPERDQRCV